MSKNYEKLFYGDLNKNGMANLINQLKSSCGHKLLKDFPLGPMIGGLSEHRIIRNYNKLPHNILATWNQILTFWGETMFSEYNKLLALVMIKNFSNIVDDRQYPQSVIEQFNKSYSRIFNSITVGTPDYFKNINDKLIKDLCICSQKLIPAGAQVVDYPTGFSKSLVIKGGLKQAISFIKMVFYCGGTDRYFQIHTHDLQLDDFNPYGWDQCYIRIAELMKYDKSVRGMFGGSWFYDPNLQKVSPRLAYLGDVPIRGGAYLFYSGVNIHGGALSKSNTRKRLYKEGKYIPRSYTLVWPRKELMYWTNSQEAN